MNNGVGGNVDGRIAMGNSLPGTFNPVDRLHLHQTGGTTAIRFSNGATGFTATDGLQIGVLPLGGAIIRHYEPARSILLGTNDGANGTVDRMKIGSFADNGFVSIGTINYFPTPLALLHLSNIGPTINMNNPALRGEMFRTDGDNNVDNTWRLFTTSPLGTSERFAVYVPANTADAHVRAASGDLYFETALQQPLLGSLERMRISTGLGNQANNPVQHATKVSIHYGSGAAPIANPVAILNLGFDAPQGPNGGQRNWMDVGTFMGAASDNMYVGLKNEDPSGSIITGSDRMDAVINWGDNISFPSQYGPDNLRFIFTSLQSPATPNGSASQNGLETMRMTPINNTTVYTGIGGDPTINLYGPLQNSQNPTATLEVNSPSNIISPIASGLRFTDLNATANPIPNPGTGVLAVDQNGDVIYVQGGTIGAPFGGNCGNTNNMTADWEIPMNNFNYVFSGQGPTGNSVGIGMPPGICNPIQAKLVVNQSSTNTNSKAILARTTDPSSCAVMAINAGPNGPVNNPQVAGWFQTYPDDYAIVVPKGSGFVSIGYTPPVSGPNYTWNNFSTFTPTAMVDVAGSIYMGGALVQTSDASLKQNIQNITDATNSVMRLRSVTFNWINPADTTMYGTHSGFIAQEVDTVIPSIVHTDGQGLKSIAYTELIPYLVKALQEEHRRNDSLSQRLTNLEGTVAGCCNTNSRMSNTNINNTDVTLTNNSSIILNQNVPNPFAQQTIIGYNLPDNVNRAQILFYDAQGKLIQTVELTTRGKGQLTVFADDLSSGVYTYALVADGQIIDTKKMIKQ
ncbi:MAG: hypothetical protein Fur0041_06570 [Bacteroidia bacterium]